MSSYRPRLTSRLPAHRSLWVTDVRNAGGRRLTPVVHPHATLALYVSGASTMWCGATYSLERGDVLIVPEGAPHYMISALEVEAIALALCTSCLTSTAGEGLARIFAEVADGASAQLTLDGPAAERLRWLLRSLGDELAKAQRWQDLAVEGYLALIASTLLRATSTAKLMDGESVEASVSARALSFVMGNASRGISLVDVARHVRRSVGHTAAVVKAETGRTVVEWITHARLATARQLLQQTDASVEEIASRLGFGSASHFHRTFRRHHGTTPGEWRSVHPRSGRPDPAPGRKSSRSDAGGGAPG